MKRYPPTVAVLTVIVWVLSAPLAMASGDCMAMGADCEGPCGASSCAVAGPISDGIVPAVAGVPQRTATRFPSAPLTLPEPPPRSTLLSA